MGDQVAHVLNDSIEEGRPYSNIRNMAFFGFIACPFGELKRVLPLFQCGFAVQVPS